MKTPVEMAISGMQTLHVQHRGQSGYRVKVRPSYVDETLFGSPAGTRPAPPDFDPPWIKKANRTRGVGTGVSQALGANGSCESTSSSGSTPTLTPRKKNKYRLISHTPSYCDESLFGSRPEGAGWEAKWMARGVPMGSQRGAEFQRMALLGRPLGRPQGIGGALLGTDRAMVGSAPPDHLWLLPAFPTDTDWRVSPDIPVSSPVTATWRISANPGGVPQEGPHLLHHTHNIVSPPSVNK